MVMFLFLVIALVVVVGAVSLAVIGGGESGALPEAAPERFTDPLPPDRPLRRADVDAVRFPMTLRGYHMDEVDDVLGRLGAELAERDARIAELEAALAGAQATAVAGPALFEGYAPGRAVEARAGEGKAAEGSAEDKKGDDQ
ncbi:DivIVA domain-containing protein [Streptomyces sp. NPDC058284]|uniref:DivIVA domain-containing protein n=1 Tax=unclassified Streptomyces TaxID=2593676 RepID=UPI00364F7D97